MSHSDDEIKILIDADVVRHFIYGGKIFDIAKIFPRRIVMVDVVKKELCRSKKLDQPVNNFISMCKIEEVKLEHNYEALSEYAELIKSVGDGEAACMALAKCEKKYIASSNLSDIREYCDNNGIKIYTTMDFLYEALMNQVYTEAECDNFIQNVISAGSKLPFDNIADYVRTYKMGK